MEERQSPHCMPQNQTHQVAVTALRSAAPVRGGFDPDRCGRVAPLDRLRRTWRLACRGSPEPSAAVTNSQFCRSAPNCFGRGIAIPQGQPMSRSSGGFWLTNPSMLERTRLIPVCASLTLALPRDRSGFDAGFEGVTNVTQSTSRNVIV
jgi:hypothetical protein